MRLRPEATSVALLVSLVGMVIGCSSAARVSEPPALASSASVASASVELATTPVETGEDPIACSPDEPAPTVEDRPGVHPPDGLLGSTGGGWQAGEVGSFEWRDGDTISEAIGVPALVPPSVTFRSAPLADPLFIALSEPAAIRSWELIFFPWEWYQQAPPSWERGSEWTGRTVGEGESLCFTTQGPGEFSLTAKFDFGDGIHAAYRWPLIVPAQ